MVTRIRSGLDTGQYAAPLQIRQPNPMRSTTQPKTTKVKNPLLEDQKRRQKKTKVGFRTAGGDSPNKDLGLLEGVKDGTEGTPGTINGVSAFIDGYLRINKRRYTRRT